VSTCALEETTDAAQTSGGKDNRPISQRAGVIEVEGRQKNGSDYRHQGVVGPERVERLGAGRWCVPRGGKRRAAKAQYG
jgi:hypothetical protein